MPYHFWFNENNIGIQASNQNTDRDLFAWFNFCHSDDHILPVADDAITEFDLARLWGMVVNVGISGITTKVRQGLRRRRR